VSLSGSPVWPGGMGSFKARKIRASKLPMPPGRSCTTLNLTVLQDAFRMSTFIRVAFAQSQAGNSGVATRTGSAGVAILTGWNNRQGG
jgi:hypothetical protein